MSTSPLPVPTEAPRVRPARLSDYAAIARVSIENGLPAPTERDWRRLWLDNPLWPRLGGTWPIGWVLEHGDVVGSVVSVPSRYRFRGLDLICANGRAWNVLPFYRAFALWLMEEYFSQATADLFVNTTVGPMATSALDELSRRVPAGDWTRVAFWVTDYSSVSRRVLEKSHIPFASTLARPAAGVLEAADAVRRKHWPTREAEVDVACAGAFDERFDAFWPELVASRPDVLLGVRDRPTLSWHFDTAGRQARLWVFTASRQHALRAYAVCVLDDVAPDVRRAQVVDYQSVEDQGDPLPALVRAMHDRCTREGVSVLEHLGVGLAKFAAFDRCAPHTRVKPCWPQYYRANDESLASALAGPGVWDPSLFDGDASFD